MHSILKNLLVFSALLTLLGQPGYCENSFPLGELIARTRDNPLVKEERTQCARALAEYMSTLDGYILELRPAEAEWIRAEQVALQRLKGKEAWVPRITALNNSVEVAQRNLKAELTRALKLTRELQTPLPYTMEIRDWNELSSILMDDVFQDGYETYAKSGKVKIPKDAKTLVDSYDMLGKGIVSLIVQPYLDQQARPSAATK